MICLLLVTMTKEAVLSHLPIWLIVGQPALTSYPYDFAGQADGNDSTPLCQTDHRGAGTLTDQERYSGRKTKNSRAREGQVVDGGIEHMDRLSTTPLLFAHSS